MKNIVIIGCGQIGSRHLQALAKMQTRCQIQVVDPDEESLRRAKERYEAMGEGKHSLSYLQQVSDLAGNVDCAIIATSSKFRLQAMKELLKHTTVNYLILEKVLFQSLEEYDVAEILLQETGVLAWVNCPKRLFPYSDRVKELLKGNIVDYQVSGSNWGLACNAIHFMDHFAYLTSDEVDSVDTSGLERKVYPSMRSDHIEFYGTLVVNFKHRGRILLECLPGESTKYQITIKAEKVECIVDEQLGALEFSGCDRVNSVNPYQNQSELTHKVVSGLLNQGKCNLPSYSFSASMHKFLISSLLELYQDLNMSDSERLPIT